MARRLNASRAEVVVIGDGVIGLSTALRLAASGLDTTLVGARRNGAASGAAAGLLAPSIGSLPPAVQRFFDASLASYDAVLESLRDFDPELRLLRGLIEVLGEGARSEQRDAQFLSPREVAELAPKISAPHGALLHSRDAAIDNVRLVAALRAAVARADRVDVVEDGCVVGISLDRSIAQVELENGSTIETDWIVLAAGAWSPSIKGLPRRLPVRPLKGQMLAVDSTAVSQPVMGEHIYIVPRGSELVIGATVEDAGFDLQTTDTAIRGLHDAAAILVPSLGDAPVTRRWAGIRPATPDMLPLIGIDPGAPRLVYASGHSKNGILLAPATAAAVCSLVGAGPFDLDLRPFSPDRFDGVPP